MIRRLWDFAVGWVQRWAMYLLLGLLALAVSFAAAQSLRLAWSQAEVSAGVAKRSKIEARADQCAADLTAQQDAVEALRERGDRLAAAAAKAQADAASAARPHEAAAQSLLQRRPPPGTDACTAAAALIREELGR